MTGGEDESSRASAGQVDVGEDTDLHPLKEDIRDLEYAGDTETLTKLREESQRTLRNQLDTLDDIDSKSMSILRINIVLLGLILTAVSIASDTPNGSSIVPVTELNNLYFVSGIVAILVSTAIAALTYTASDSDVGIQQERIYSTIDANLSEREFEVAATQTYAHWIGFNRRTILLNAPYITLTTLLIVVALIHLSLGVYDAFLGDHTLMLAIVAWVSVFFLAYGAGLHSQLLKALQIRAEEREERG